MLQHCCCHSRSSRLRWDEPASRRPDLEEAGVRIWDGATVGCAAARWHGQVGSSRMQALDSCRRPPQQHAGLHWASQDAAWFSVVSRCCKAIAESSDRDVLGSVSQPQLSAGQEIDRPGELQSVNICLRGHCICFHCPGDPQCRASLTMKMRLTAAAGPAKGVTIAGGVREESKKGGCIRIQFRLMEVGVH